MNCSAAFRSLGLAGLLAALAGAPPAHGAAQAPPAPPAAAQQFPKCDRPENRQFDFWIGHWRVVNTKDNTPAGESRIETLYGGCTLRENWVDPQLTGGSLNTYLSGDGKWHQTWTDSTGSWREFVGGLVGGKMVLVWFHPSRRVPGATAQERMTFTPNADGSVRQYMDQTSDGQKWVEGYDYTYRRVRD